MQYFSKEFARKILEYKNNRKELVDKINNVYTDFNVNNPFIDCSENDGK